MALDFLTTLQQMRDGTFDYKGQRWLHERMRTIEAARADVGEAETKRQVQAVFKVYQQRQQNYQKQAQTKTQNNNTNSNNNNATDEAQRRKAAYTAALARQVGQAAQHALEKMASGANGANGTTVYSSAQRAAQQQRVRDFLMDGPPRMTRGQLQDLAESDAKTQFKYFLQLGRVAMDNETRMPAWMGQTTTTREGAEHKDFTGTVETNAPVAQQSGLAQISGYLAVYNNVDSYNDVILPFAFRDSLAALKAQQVRRGSPYLFPLLAGHDPHCPIGGVKTAEEDGFGLWITAEIDLDTQDGRDAYSGITKSYNSGLSIGYIVDDKRYRSDGVRELVKLELFEGSVTPVPANSLAGVTSSRLN